MIDSFRTIDFETWLFAPGRMAPKPVVLAVATEAGERLKVGDDMRRTLAHYYDQAAAGLPVVGQFVAYDNAVAMEAWPELTRPIFDAYDADGVADTRVAEKLIDIAGGRLYAGKPPRQYSLEDMARRRLGIAMDKDTWRLRYAELDGVPLDRWPEGAREYPLGDVRVTRDLLRDQWRRALEIGYSLPDLAAQCRGSFALHLMGCWGVRTDGEYVARMRAGIAENLAALRPKLVHAGLMDAKGKRSNKALQSLVVAELGDAAPRTPKGALKIDADTLADLEHPAAKLWKVYTGLQKIDSTYLSKLGAGAVLPIHARWNELVESGRTSCGTPNWQNPPRGSISIHGVEMSVRECVVARPGFVLVAADYDGAELRALAQACLTIIGWSRLADRYKEDPEFDPHLEFASQMEGIDYAEGLRRKKTGDERMKDLRQRAKASNFGFPGGLGARGFVRYAKGYGLALTEHQSIDIRDRWFDAWPEMREYFRFVGSVVGQGNNGTIVQLVSGRKRGGVGYCDGANTIFQGLTADIAKAALYETTRRCYSVSTSRLHGCRPILFLHDEIILEAPEWKAHEAAQELTEVMVEIAGRYMPDVPSRATPTIMRRWSKQAKPVFEGGRLIPWDDRR